MTTPTSPISFLDIQNEFGGSTPISLDEYYRGGGGGYVPAGQGDGGYGVIPSGTPGTTISILPFRNQSKSFTFNDVVSANMANYNLWARALAAGWNGSTVLYATVTINAGVTVYGTTGNAAWATWGYVGPPTAFPAGTTITLINNGTIAGYGGAGGVGGSVSGTTITAGGSGSAGGLAFSAHSAISVYNYGTIGGGGGGGGGGGAARNTLDTKTYYAGSGGGGGGGRTFGAAGLAGTCTGNDTNGLASAGSAGTISAPGAGGARFVIGSVIGTGYGGNGGDLGNPGSPGTLPDLGYVNGGYSNPGAGGSAGAAISGGAYVTWYSFGSRLGTIDNPGINMVPAYIDTSWNGGNVDAYRISAGSASARVTFNSDGTITQGVSASGVTITGPFPGLWYNPSTVSIGASYWIRVTITGDALSGGTTGTWLSLASPQSFTITVTGSAGAFVSKLTNLNISFASDSGGSTIVGTASITLTATKDV